LAWAFSQRRSDASDLGLGRCGRQCLDVTPSQGSQLRRDPLHWAASSNDVVAIDALLDLGADIEAAGAIFTGGAPLSDAVVFANWEAALLP
jgi:ankyrin repeat protein